MREHSFVAEMYVLFWLEIKEVLVMNLALQEVAYFDFLGSLLIAEQWRAGGPEGIAVMILPIVTTMEAGILKNNINQILTNNLNYWKMTLKIWKLIAESLSIPAVSLSFQRL